MISVMNLHEKNMTAKEHSNYISNMMLPEMVQATRQQPLGPDCIISNKEVTDQTLLNSMHYYWYISHEKGCVECIMKKSRIQENVTASDPRCVITRKHRRFEAYCCMICRSNFVTIVQALLHLKAIHRPTSKILIQDKDIFRNIDKAMEVPPVPLPWHIAKKLVEHEKTPTDMGSTPTFVIPPGALSTGSSATFEDGSAVTSNVQNLQLAPSKGQSHSPSYKQTSEKFEHQSPSAENAESPPNPMVCIITAIAEEFQKQISQLTFNDDCSQANVKFVDGTNVVAKTPDLTKNSISEFLDPILEETANTELKFSLQHDDVPQYDESDVKYVTLRANKPSLAKALFTNAISHGTKALVEKVQASPTHSTSSSEIDSELPERAVPEVHSPETKTSVMKPFVNRPVKSVRFQLGAPDSSDDETPDTPNQDSVFPSGNEANATTGDGEGSRNVVDDLISTASKGRIPFLPPTSPSTTSPSMTAFVPTPVLPLVGSSPALSSLVQINSGSKTKTNPLTRVQSWSPSLGGTSFSVASMRRPYTARGFTYAEKIELMKQQNDYDAEFTTKHIRKSTSSPTSSVVSPSYVQSSQMDTLGTNVVNAGKKSEGNHRISNEPRVHNQDSGSDGERDIHDEYTSRHADDEHNSDSDDSPPTLLGSVNAMAAAYSTLLRSGLRTSAIFPSEYYGSGEWATTAMETLKSLQSSIKSTEENTNRIPSRLSTSSTSPTSNITVKQELSDPPHSFAVHVKEHNESLSDDNSISQAARNKQFKVKFSASRKRCKSNNESNMPAADIPSFMSTVSKRRKLHEKASESDMDAVSISTDSESSVDMNYSSSIKTETSDEVSLRLSKAKVHKAVERLSSQHSANKPLSPLLTNAEREFLQPKKDRVVSTVKSSAFPVKSVETNIEKPLTNNPGLISHLTSKSMGSKCSSDPALSMSSRSNNCVTTSSASRSMLSSRVSNLPQDSKYSNSSPAHVEGMLAKSGDSLSFMDNVMLRDFENRKTILTKLQTPGGSAAGERRPEESKMHMPEVFRNCIETRVKIQLIDKVHVCKVCGYSVVTTNPSNTVEVDKILQAHVMEHSLKELYATGYEMGKW
ncbi:uncharacterized protein LOC143466001 isoform X1 [Clavelina lepadiformis]|uniref:uncharacterized protein LOC143466001 isoform X1 n=2 Tax=Clavelina lepadiformis TaxID=159417 RepID=UPI00404310F6